MACFIATQHSKHTHLNDFEIYLSFTTLNALFAVYYGNLTDCKSDFLSPSFYWVVGVPIRASILSSNFRSLMKTVRSKIWNDACGWWNYIVGDRNSVGPVTLSNPKILNISVWNVPLRVGGIRPTVLREVRKYGCSENKNGYRVRVIRNGLDFEEINFQNDGIVICYFLSP